MFKKFAAKPNSVAREMRCLAPLVGQGGSIDLDQVLEDSATEYECGICFQIMERPTSGCPEGHACCQACYETHLKHQKKCPTCRAPTSIKRLQFNRPLANLIAQLKVRCNHAADEQTGHETGCPWTGRVSELAEHLDACKWGCSITCPVPECGKVVHLPNFEAHMLAEHPGKSPIQTLAEQIHFTAAMQKLKRENSPSLIIQMMNRLLSHKNLQVNGCMALLNLANHHAENRTRIASAGGIEAVVKAMQTHAQSADVQQEGCGALWNLAFNHAENQSRIAAAGGIEAVVKAMQTHAQSADVQQEGCRALRNSSFNHAENKARIADAGFRV